MRKRLVKRTVSCRSCARPRTWSVPGRRLPGRGEPALREAVGNARLLATCPPHRRRCRRGRMSPERRPSVWTRAPVGPTPRHRPPASQEAVRRKTTGNGYRDDETPGQCAHAGRPEPEWARGHAARLEPADPPRRRAPARRPRQRLRGRMTERGRPLPPAVRTVRRTRTARPGRRQQEAPRPRPRAPCGAPSRTRRQRRALASPRRRSAGRPKRAGGGGKPSREDQPAEVEVVSRAAVRAAVRWRPGPSAMCSTSAPATWAGSARSILVRFRGVAWM